MIDVVKEIMEQISKEIASDIDKEIFMNVWYLHFSEGSEGYNIMVEYKDARDNMKETNPRLDMQRMEYINSMDDVTSEHFTGAEIRALGTYFAACDRYNEARKRYVQFFKEAHDKCKKK